MPFQCTRRPSNATYFSMLATALLTMPAASAWGAPAAVPRPSTLAASPQATRLDWIEEAMELIRRLYIALGGNPAELEGRASIETAMSLVNDYYWRHGLPPMDQADRDTLAVTIHDLYSLLGNPPSTVNPDAACGFRKTLVAIWIAMGLDPQVLGG
jgi:hypothetical protein